MALRHSSRASDVTAFAAAARSAHVDGHATASLRTLAQAVRYVVWLGLATGAGSAWLMPSVAQAQNATAVAAAQVYSIPAGSLAEALRAFATTAGVELTVDGTLVQGKQSQGLNGSYSVGNGFAALVNPHGLQAVQQSNGSYVLQAIPAPAQAGAQSGALPEVVVTAAASNSTENTGSYTQAAPSTAANGLAMTQQKTPQSVSVVTRQQIDDWNLVTLQDLAKVTPGIYFKNSGVSDQEAQAYARGFVINQLNVDGQSLGTSNFNGRAIGSDMAMYDSVEVVRGATGLLQGVGQPSGSINLVRKRPTAEPLLNVTASLGSWSDKRITVDASRALNATGTVRARVVANGQDADSFVDVTNDRNGLLYGIVEVDLTPVTQVAFGASVQRTRTDGLFRGLPTYTDGSHMGLPRSTFLDVADNYQDRDTDMAFAEFRHRLDNDWTLKAVYTYTDGSSDSRYSNNSRIAGSEATFASGETGWKYSTEQHNFDLRANGPVQLWGRTHELVIGANLREDDVSWDQTWNGTGDGRIVEIGNWDPYAHHLTGGLPANGGLQQQRSTTEKGLFAAGNFELADPLHLVLGGRLSWFKEKGTGGWYTGVQPAFKQSLHESAQFVPYVGLVYDLNEQHSVYASLTEIFSPQSAQDVNGNTLKPITGTNYELGIKGEYWDGALNASAAVFRINQRNRAIRDDANCPTGGVVSCSRAAGEVQSEGIELQLAGTITPAWQLSAGYTYTSAKYTKDQVQSNVGKRIANDEPRHLFRLASSYRLPGALNQWSVQGSLTGQSKIYSAETNYYTEQGSYVIAGLGASYRFNKQMQVQLNVDNLFDKTYYTGLGASWSGGGARYGKPRSVLVTGRYTF